MHSCAGNLETRGGAGSSRSEQHGSYFRRLGLSPTGGAGALDGGHALGLEVLGSLEHSSLGYAVPKACGSQTKSAAWSRPRFRDCEAPGSAPPRCSAVRDHRQGCTVGTGGCLQNRMNHAAGVLKTAFSGCAEDDRRGSADHRGADRCGKLLRCRIGPHEGPIGLRDDVGPGPLEDVHFLDHDVAVVGKPQRGSLARMDRNARSGRGTGDRHDRDDVEPVDRFHAVDVAGPRLGGVFLAVGVLAGPEITVIDDGAGLRRSRSCVLPACGFAWNDRRPRRRRLRSCPGLQGGTPAARW